MPKRDKKIAVFYVVIGFILTIGLIVYGYIFNSLHKNTTNIAQLDSLSNVQLFVEPAPSKEPLLQAIEKANASIDLEVYTMSDDNIVSELINAKKRGVYVRVILEENPYNGYGANKDVKDKLSHYGIDAKWSNRVYQYTHSKFMVIDKTTGYILTFNLSKSAFTKNREFGVIINDTETVNELLNIFSADWERKPYTSVKSALVVSPENSRKKIINLINSAKNEIVVYAEEVEDRQFMDAVEKKAKSGVRVYAILADPSSLDVNKSSIDEFKNNMINVKSLSSPFIHAKAIIVDNTLAYVGSVNFSSTSFDKNREVGVIISSQEAIAKLRETFFTDFSKK